MECGECGGYCGVWWALWSVVGIVECGGYCGVWWVLGSVVGILWSVVGRGVWWVLWSVVDRRTDSTQQPPSGSRG